MLDSLLAKLAVAAIALAIAFSAGWKVNGWKLTSSINAEHLAELKAATDGKKEAEDQRDKLAAQLKTSNDLHAAELQKAHDETNSYRDRVSAGSMRLSVAAKCPAAVAVLPEASSSPSVDSGARAELDPEARSAYFSLRDGINSAEGKLSACQDELRNRTK